ncbi:uncharacterized protein LOC101858718 isoform X3 [Aplysia californica]|nr:uncharacterized protein LOC101858718 isoform X2 [Aplysia californica]XP_005100111.1 uncharacterized protein LOC101858718 isoform X2 [Aplysia californica]XP_012938930.1 uncharacterized protein LOC101858718 isoform X3 [Aplysia californica]
MEDEILNRKDDSRPAFARPPCCMGIYLDALDARPDKTQTVGSQHAFMMSVMDKMLDHLKALDLSVVKGAMETRHIGDGVILEGFKLGCILAVTFDNPKSLDNLWTLHVKNRLSAAFQDMIVDKALLRATNTVKITLRAKLWEDEYRNCQGEMKARPTGRVKLKSQESDLAMVQRVQAHCKKMSEVILQARDMESKFEHGLGEFMLTVKRTFPQSTTVIRNVKEFETNVKMAKGVQKGGFDNIDHFFTAVEFFRKVFLEVEKELIHPLCQVRALCENDNQQNLKKTMKNACAEVLAILKPDADLQKIRHKEWGPKVLQREQGLFYGLISLIPISLDRLTTIDVSIDEYVNDFPEMASK